MKTERESPFARRLRDPREAAGPTQEELAARAGLTAKAASALERGERRRPYPHIVRSLADALDLPEDERLTLQAAVQRRGAPSTRLLQPRSRSRSYRCPRRRSWGGSRSSRR